MITDHLHHLSSNQEIVINDGKNSLEHSTFDDQLDIFNIREVNSIISFGLVLPVLHISDGMD